MNAPRNCLLLGAGGMGMAPLALYLREAGSEVEAFDDSFREPIRGLLEKAGVRLLSEPFPSRRPDVVVRSSAVSEDRPELLRWRNLGVPVYRRGDYLARLLVNRKILAVVGSHGKTTTAAMITWLLHKAKYSFGYLVGGLFRDLNVLPAAYSEEAWVVVEVDESDGTIDSFQPEVTLALNCDWDHADHYDSPQDFRDTLTSLFARTKSCVLIPAGDELEDLSRSSACCQTMTFDSPLDDAAYNDRNASAAFAACRAIDVEPVPDALDDFPGLARRQVLLGETSDRLILEDYAHHPTEIRAVLSEAKEHFPNRRLRVVFQPHRFSRTSTLGAGCAEELSAADDLFFLPTYGAYETPYAAGNVENLIGFLPPRLRDCSRVFHNFLSLRRAIGPSSPLGDQLLFLGAGDVERYAHAFAASESSEGDPWRAWAKYLNPRLSDRVILRMEEPLADMTTLRVGGSARAYAEPECIEDLRELVDACSLFDLPFFVIGRGSNLIVPDEGYDGLVLRLARSGWRGVRPEGESILVVDAGTRLKEICRLACERGLSGFEFLEGIPGTLGGALCMNAGAMGGEFCDLVESVTILMPDGNLREIPGDDLTVGYRHCSEAEKGIVLRARLRASGHSNRKEVRRRIDDFAKRRWKSQPRESSAGCIFRNPAHDSAGRLIDCHGLKGETLGGASVSNVHANFIVNHGGATADEVIGLIRRVRNKVKDSSGVVLEPEVTILGRSWKETFN